jgi:hypothetical protein
MSPREPWHTRLTLIVISVVVLCLGPVAQAGDDLASADAIPQSLLLESNQFIWFDGMAVFTCAIPSSEDSARDLTSQLASGKTEESK